MEFLCVDNTCGLACSKIFAILQFLRSWFSLCYIHIMASKISASWQYLQIRDRRLDWKKISICKIISFYSFSPPLFLLREADAYICSMSHTWLVYLKVSDEKLAAFIDQHILGVLVYFDQILLQKSYHVSYKENVITSLSQLIRLLGTKRVTVLRVKVATSLKWVLSIALIRRVPVMDAKSGWFYSWNHNHSVWWKAIWYATY